jgi:glycosyltransferase involved in cell wall biosynthesis
MSGGVAVIFQHANRLRRRGHDVFVAVENKREVDWFPGLQAPVISLNEYPNDVDVLVATGWQTSYGVVDLPARKKFYFVQSDETRFHPEGQLRDLTALSYRLDFNYLTEARWIQKWLLENFGHEAELIPNGLEPELFHATEPLEPKGTKPRILLEGTIALPSKGMADAFAAVADLDAEVWCVSTYGKPQPGWRCDRFFERVPMIEMKRIYSSCDVLLKLSRVEGFFGPPMEMMACGGVVVAGKVSGYDEYIVDGYNALTVDLGDIAAARDAVAKVISDDALRSKLIANGFETAKQWQWEPSIDRLERYYQDVLAGRRGKTDSAVKQSADRAISQAQRSLSLNQNPQALAAQLAEKDALLASIYASTAWRLIQSLWRIRMALIPHGSRRERLWLRIKDRVQKFLSQN